MKNWERIALKKEDSIHKALGILNDTGSQFIVVIDEYNKLLGTVTDGDIRRGLLQGIQIQDSLNRVMNTTPKSLATNTPKSKIFKMMKEKDINHLPLVNLDSTITEIVSLNEIIHVEKKENYVVLMVGGLGTRLASLTSDCPKSMLKVGGKPILETIIEVFKEHGFYKFILAVNYKSEIIENYFQDGKYLDVEVSYIKEPTRMGTAGALSLYQGNNLPLIVMNGDLLTKINFTDLLSFHAKNSHVATMCLRQYEHQIPFGVVVTEQDQVIKIEEKPTKRYFVNGGIYVLNPDAVDIIPKNTSYDMTTLFEDFIDKNLKIGAYPFYEYWVDIGRLDDYEKAHSEFLGIFK